MHKKLLILFVLFVALYIIFMLIYPLCIHDKSWDEALEFWKDWQTLTAAIIALCASIIALYATQYSEEQTRKRQLTASRSFLVFALNELTIYCEQSMLYYFHASQRNITQNDATPEIPQLPEHAFERIKDFIDVASHTHSKKIIDIIGHLQVHQARLEDWNSRTSRHNAKSELMDATIIKALIAAHFDYARFEKETIEYDKSAIIKSVEFYFKNPALIANINFQSSASEEDFLKYFTDNAERRVKTLLNLQKKEKQHSS